MTESYALKNGSNLQSLYSISTHIINHQPTTCLISIGSSQREDCRDNQPTLMTMTREANSGVHQCSQSRYPKDEALPASRYTDAREKLPMLSDRMKALGQGF